MLEFLYYLLISINPVFLPVKQLFPNILLQVRSLLSKSFKAGIFENFDFAVF